MQSAQSAQENPETSSMYYQRGREADESHYRTGDTIWQVRLSKDYGYAEERELASESQKSGTDLEARGIEGAEEAAEKKKAMA